MATTLDLVRTIAGEQSGLFTARQAADEGVSYPALLMLARRGRLERPARGVYRLPIWPADDRAQYFLGLLWLQANRILPWAVISHESALELYDLTNLNPSAIHVSVPRGTRSIRDIPEWLRIHREDIPINDRWIERSVPCVTVPRAIEEIADLGSDRVHEAVSDAREKHLLRDDELERLVKRFGHEILEPYHRT